MVQLTCGVGNHTEIIGSDYATCIVCKTVRRLSWAKMGSRYYIDKDELKQLVDEQWGRLPWRKIK